MGKNKYFDTYLSLIFVFLYISSFGLAFYYDKCLNDSSINESFSEPNNDENNENDRNGEEIFDENQNNKDSNEEKDKKEEEKEKSPQINMYDSVIVRKDNPKKNSVYLTFDDGPDNKITSQIIDILAANGVAGSFFFIGKNIKSYPEIVKKAFDNNNYVAGHTFSHLHLTKINSEKIENEIIEANTLIEKIIGKKPAHFRPPYGEINQNVINTAKKLNLKIAMWSIDPKDWQDKKSETIVKSIEENLFSGGIIVMHSTSKNKETLLALEKIIKIIKSKGYTFATFKYEEL